MFKKHPRQGGILFMTVAAIGVTLGLLAMVIDVSWMYFHRNKLQNSIAAAWKAGYDEMIGILRQTPDNFDEKAKEKIRKRISLVFMENGFSANEATALSINFAGVGTFPEKLEIGISKKLDLFFATGIDFPFVTISVFHDGRIPSLNGSSSNFLGDLREGFIFPVGIPHGEVQQTPGNRVSVSSFEGEQSFSPGKTYLLRPGRDPAFIGATASGSSDISNNCSLQLNFDSASDYSYASAILFGYPRPLTVNDRLEIIGSDVSSIIDKTLQTRLNQAHPVRKVVIPILDVPPEIISTTGLKAIQIYHLDPEKDKARVTGFALFELEPPEGASPGSVLPGQIRGKFIRYVVNPKEVFARLK